MSILTRTLARDGRTSSIEFMRCSLVVVEGSDAGKRIDIEGSSTRIGTSQGSTLALTDDAVSRNHCEILVDERGFLLKDTASRNGTFLDGLQVREIYLEPGTIFTVGKTRIELKASDEKVEIRLSDADRFGLTLGRSTKMREIFYLLERMAKQDVTILLTGETGTGKDVLARSIHDESARKDRPLVTVDCGTLSEELVEAELFGHAKGAFTGAVSDRAGAFEEANGGTVFLDEIGELPLSQQTKLLRVLEGREIRRVGETKMRPVDVRVIAATNRDLADEVEEEKFRKDLYYRLQVLEVRVPALRERPEDVELLTEHFLHEISKRLKRTKPALSQHALYALRSHPWPGNVRELRNVLEKALVMSTGDAIEADAIALGSLRNEAVIPENVTDVFRLDPYAPYDEAHDRFEREYLARLLRLHNLNITHAAKAAGIHRQTIHRLLRKHGIRLEDFR